MSLPTSDTNPDSFLRLPADQNKQIRQIIRSAGVRDLKQFLNDLRRRSTPHLGYFLELGLSAILLFVAILLNSHLLLVLAVVFAPFFSPNPGIASAMVIPSFPHLGKSLLTILITSGVYFLTGWLSALAVKTTSPAATIPFPFVIQSTWLEWAVVLVAGILLAVWFVRRSEMARAASIVLALMVMVPLALAGSGLVLTSSQPWGEILTLALSRLLLSILASLAAFWTIGLAPRKALGWVTASMLVILAVIAGYNLTNPVKQPVVDAISALPTATASPTASPTSLPTNTVEVATETPTAPPTAEPTATLVPTSTPTPAPVFARITASTGLLMRAEANTQSIILAYINYGDIVQLLGEQTAWGAILWEKIIAPNGKTGWIPTGYMVTVTPTN